MPSLFPRGKLIGQDDLSLSLVDSNDLPVDAYEISYAIYDVTTGFEIPIGSTERKPIHPERGLYYAHFYIPEDAALGLYRIRWTFQETTTSPQNVVLEEFEVVEADTFKKTLWTELEGDMVRRLRILLRDHRPDKFYRFRPPTTEGTINQYNRVFAHVWDDDELLEYMSRGVDIINMFPPETHWNTIDSMIKAKPAWRQMILMAAIAHACMALSLNWISEEFSIVGDEKVRLLLPSGKEVDVTFEELYDICYGEAVE